LFIMGDVIGRFNIGRLQMGYRTANIDRISSEGAVFTDWCGQQSCTVTVRLSSPASRLSVPA
jgi:arylsulfatase A-like enzyme